MQSCRHQCRCRSLALQKMSAMVMLQFVLLRMPAYRLLGVTCVAVSIDKGAGALPVSLAIPPCAPVLVTAGIQAEALSGLLVCLPFPCVPVAVGRLAHTCRHHVHINSIHACMCCTFAFTCCRSIILQVKRPSRHARLYLSPLAYRQKPCPVCWSASHSPVYLSPLADWHIPTRRTLWCQGSAPVLVTAGIQAEALSSLLVCLPLPCVPVAAG